MKKSLESAGLNKFKWVGPSISLINLGWGWEDINRTELSRKVALIIHTADQNKFTDGQIISFFFNFSFFKIKFLLFKSSFKSTAKLRERHRGSPDALCPHTCMISRFISISLLQSGTLVPKDELTQTHNHPNRL